LLQNFKSAVDNNSLDEANRLLKQLKVLFITYDSLPPTSLPTPNAEAECILARDTFEYAVILAIKLGDKELFQRYMSSLRSYYTSSRFTKSNYSYNVLIIFY
jgi:hypothetical protein